MTGCFSSGLSTLNARRTEDGRLAKERKHSGSKKEGRRENGR